MLEKMIEDKKKNLGKFKSQDHSEVMMRMNPNEQIEIKD